METSPLRPSVRLSVPDRLRSWIEWFGAGRLVAAAVSVIAVCVAAMWLVRAPAPTTESRLPYAGGAGSASASTVWGSSESSSPFAIDTTTTTSAPPLVVHVAGQVQSPGVYQLATGARVIDAVEHAGGTLVDADLDVVNLAAPVADGQRVFVPRVGQAPPLVVTGTGGGVTSGGAGVGAAGGVATGPVDLNSATAEQLDTLPGVGPATAAAIAAYREQHGPFTSVEQLGDVRGIGPAKLDALRDLVSV